MTQKEVAGRSASLRNDYRRCPGRMSPCGSPRPDNQQGSSTTIEQHVQAAGGRGFFDASRTFRLAPKATTP